MAVVRMQAKGQMTVPEAMRKAMGIETGTELVCMQTAPDAFECRVLPVPMGLRAYLDTHALSGPGTTQEEIDTAIEAGILAEHSDLIHDLEAKEEAHSTIGRR